MLDALDPLVRDWFVSRFGDPTGPQMAAWPVIRSGGDVLLSAPTGSGKTLAAFLICIDSLVRRARIGALPDRTEVLYVSPLKALSNDIRKNLESPLAEIAALAVSRGIPLAPVRTAVRTGDTARAERDQMGRHPPHILVTTPESLFILLTAARSRQALRGVRTVILDEIHAVADDKRGSHLALSIARLERASGAKLQRIGLSATVRPIEEVASFLGPGARILQFGHRREIRLAVEVPKDELGAVATNEMWAEIYDRLAELARARRTTLVFVNTRRLAERVAHHLGERLGPNAVLPHHGSLSRSLRLDAEARLKAGELRVVVATASLELGIDIGAVDLVCQIGSPRSIAVGLQRIGRSGHWKGAVPEGRLFATTRDELIECAALVRAIRRGELDRTEIPVAPIDILAQQIIAETACEEYSEDELYELVRRAYPYRALPRPDFDALLEMLAEGITTARGRRGAYLHRDRVNRRVRARRGARLAAITSGGAIPENASYQVIAEPEEKAVGALDEDFAVESMAGDVFLLGTTSWRIRRVEPGRVRVEDAHGAAPSIPFWRGEAPGRTRELSAEVSLLREELAARIPAAAQELLRVECGVEERGAAQAVEYVRAAASALGALPSQQLIVAERFFDEAGGMQLVLHAPFGSRINRAWGLALRKRFCRSFNFELQAAATDNGIVISLGEHHSFPLEIVFGFVTSGNVEHVLTQALLDAPMFTARWRWNVSRALAVLRASGGRRVPPPIQRMRSDDLLAAVFPDQAACAENLTGEIRIPDHPLVRETIGNCLHEAMDLNGLRELIARVENGAVRTLSVETPEPSVFSHEILNANPYAYLDDAPLEERRARAVQLRRTLPPDSAASLGALDPEAIRAVEEESWPAVRDPDELHDALLTLGVLPPVPQWLPFFGALAAAGRAAVLHAGERDFWMAAERVDLVRRAYPESAIAPPLSQAGVPRDLPETREGCLASILRGWLDSIGPITADDLAARLALPGDLASIGLAQLEAEGQILRGKFRSASTEWCNRRILARIHRLTVGRLRSEIEPVTSADFMRFLCRWQHAAAGTQLHGVDGLFEIIRQLQGYEIPAAAWEAEILPRRIARYDPEWLDRLCLSGEVMWGRLSPHPALESEQPKRVRATRSAPVSIFLREHAAALVSSRPFGSRALSHPARDVLSLIERRGASFFNELVRGSGRLPSEVEDGLWELVAAGFVTADGFENLRALVDARRRRGEGRGRDARPRHAAGRWALLHPGDSARGDAAPAAAEAFASQLLARWGVVFRDLLAREPLAPAWRDLLAVYRRMEARGDIRGGRFVSGYVGEQFARPEAVELLRSVRRSEKTGEGLRLSLADPLNLVGTILPGVRQSPLMRGSLHLVDGVVAA